MQARESARDRPSARRTSGPIPAADDRRPAGTGATLVPGAVAGPVQVDPGDQPVPRFGIELDAIMALLEHLHQFAGVGVILARHVQPHVVLDVHAADVRIQHVIGRRVERPAVARATCVRLGTAANRSFISRSAGSSRLAPKYDSGKPFVIRKEAFGAQIGQRPALLARPAVVAAHAILVQHRLHFALEVEPPRRPIPGLDLHRLLAGGQVERVAAALVGLLVAAHAGGMFARHRRVPAPHQRQGLAFGVQRLNA